MISYLVSYMAKKGGYSLVGSCVYNTPRKIVGADGIEEMTEFLKEQNKEYSEISLVNLVLLGEKDE